MVQPAPVVQTMPAPALPPAPAAAPATPAPVATPTPAAALIPTLAPAPVQAPAPTAAVVQPSAITPTEASPSEAARSAAPGAGGLPGAASAPPREAVRAPPASYPSMMWGQPGQRSLADMANEQINGGRAPRNKLAEGMAGAELPDCIRPNAGGSLFGLATIPYAAATGKCKAPK